MNTINQRQESTSKSNILFPYGKWNALTYDSERICIARGEGICLFSEDGKKYFDAISGLWNNPLGYSQDSITMAIQEQAKQISSCSLFDYTYRQVEENAGRILRLHDLHMSKICYTCSGSEAVDLAIKIVRKASAVKGYLKKKKIVSLVNSYHGTTYGALTISGGERKVFSEFGPGIGDSIKISACYEQNGEIEKIGEKWKSDLEKIEEQSDLIAGIVIEPIVLSDGILDLSHLFLQKLCDLCRQNDIFLVFDEVATGFYRTGFPFCYQKYGVRPDIVCMSKAINAGYLPLGAVAISRECEKILDDDFQEQFLHGSTQSGNPLAIAASNATLQIYDRLFMDDSVICRTKKFAEKLNHSLQGKKLVKKVDVNGNLVLIQLKNIQNKTDICAVNEYRCLLRKQGILTYPALSGLLMLPMYITSDTEYDEMVKIIQVSFR